MTKLPSTRVLIAIALVVLFLIVLIAFLFITQLSFSVWEQLQHKPDWIIVSYLLAVVLIALMFGRLVWRFLTPKKSLERKLKQDKKDSGSMETVAQRLEIISQNLSSENSISQRSDGYKNTSEKGAFQKNVKNNSMLHKPNSDVPGSEKSENFATDENNSHSSAGHFDEALINQWSNEFDESPEVAAIRAELQEYSRRKTQQTIYIALFGDISSGKSSLIKALINYDADASVTEQESEPVQAELEQSCCVGTSVIGGTTRKIKHYHWNQARQHTGNNGNTELNKIILTDMPGLNEQFAQLDILATEEVRRAHMVLFLCDGDLTATQFEELKRLLELQKPCIVVVNKSDRFNDEERQLILQTIRQRLEGIGSNVSIVSINAGGKREFIRLTPDGEEERVQRSITPELEPLLEQIQKLQQQYDPQTLESLREKSVASMLNSKLDDLDARFKQSQSRRMINSYTKKAVVASMATISPGTDLLVQGYLGIQMIKELCRLYGVSASDIDANKLIELIQSRMDKTMPLLLAIAGNGLKAFPGIGTVTGGLMHAVAYGMIFDTLGRSVARTLEVTGELSPTLISDLYKEQLGENIESRTKDFIRLVLKLRKGD